VSLPGPRVRVGHPETGAGPSMYEIEGPAARPPVLRPGCPCRADRRPCCRASVGPPSRSRSPARSVGVPHPRARSRGPPIASASAVHVRRAAAPVCGCPPTLTGEPPPRRSLPRSPAPKGLVPRPPTVLGVAERLVGPRRSAAVSRCVPPPELPPGGPPVVLGVGVVLRRFPQGAQGVSGKFLHKFVHPQDVHNLSSGKGRFIPRLSPGLCTGRRARPTPSPPLASTTSPTDPCFLPGEQPCPAIGRGGKRQFAGRKGGAWG
jgi:hypothetical protein